MSTNISKRFMGTFLILVMALSQVMPMQTVHADHSVVLVDNLQPSWTAPGGGGVFSAYIAPPAYGYVSPGATALYDGREAGIIKAGLTAKADGHYDDEGLFGFAPTVTIEDLAGDLTYDVINEQGTNPVWMTIEIDTGIVGDRNDNTTYQHVPTDNPAEWHTVDAGAGLWQKWNNNEGDVSGNPLISLADVALAHPGLNVARVYLRLGQGDSYHGSGTGTIGWVDQVTIADVTYDFVLPDDWYVSTTGADTNAGTEASPFQTIQHAIDTAGEGDTIHIAAGSYTENVQLNKRVSLVGAGAATVITNAAGGDASEGVLQVSASGLSAQEPVLLKDLSIQPVGRSGISIGRFTQSTGTNVSYLSLENVNVTGTNLNPCTEQERGLYVDLTSSLQHLSITGGSFDNLTYGWYFQKAVSADTSTVQDVTVEGTTFNHNNLKGLYAEKLEDATFTNIEVDGNGFSTAADLAACPYFQPWQTGIDINLKAGSYQDISFVNPRVTDNALGNAKEGSGMGLKARDDGTTYGPFPATLDHVQITGGTITGNERGIRVGEPGKNNAGPTNVQIHSSTISDNLKTYTGTDGSAYGGVVNQSLALVDAANNWWGAASGPGPVGPGTGDGVTTNVTFIPWCTDETCETSVTPPVHNTTKGTYHSTIQAAIDAATEGDTITVAAGTYVENVVVNKSVSIAGAGAGSTIVRPAVSNPNPCTGSSLCGGAASNVFLIQANNVVIHDLTVDGDNPALTSGIVRDGADLDARNGIIKNTDSNYNGLEVYNTTVQNIYLRGIYSTGGTFNFHHNTVSNVQGDGYSIGMFAWGGPGTMANNTVSHANDAISANHSSGIQFLNNTVTHSGSGVHTDNAGDSGGVADLIQGNNVSDCTPHGYGIWTFVPYLAPTVNNNTVTNCEIGLSAWGQGAAVTHQFTNNTVTGDLGAESVGAYITTDLIGWGYTDISVNFTGNRITGFETGVYLIADQQSWNTYPYEARTISADFHSNQIYGNTDGAVKGTTGTYSAEFERNWWGNANGPSGAGPGTGDSVAAGFNYLPWCTNQGCTEFGTLPVHNINKNTYYNTIQAAIDDANADDVINVAAGTFIEQLNIAKSLHLVGVGTDSIIQAPATLPDSSQATSAIVLISGSGVDVELTGFTISGPGPSACGSIRAGIFVRDGANANIHHNSILDIRDAALPVSGCQNGIAIVVGRQAWGTSATATIADNTITRYQKGGIVVDNTGSSAVITNNAITGAGTISITAQNGIQISRGATATITGNTVTGNSYHLAGSTWDWGAAGILLYQAGAVTLGGGNSVIGNDVNLSNDSTALILGAETIGNSSAPVNSGYDIVHYGTNAIDATDVSFAGAADNFAIEDRIWHAIDESGIGLVTWEAGNVYITPLSEGYQTGALQRGVNAVSEGGTVNVAAGTYSESLNIAKSLTLHGAQYNVNVTGRTAGSASESTIQGLITINASNITLNGFTLTNPGQTYAISITPASQNVTITNNIVDNVGATTLNSNVHAVVFQNGADSVTIADNRFSNIKAGTKSVSVIGVLDSVSTNPSAGVVIRGNIFTDIASAGKGAYGIIINNAAGAPGAQIKDNTFSGLSGGWTHAIGLEGPTPDAVVTGNIFSNLTVATGTDNAAILFEKNPAGNSVTVTGNQFNGTGFYGVAIHPNDLPGGSNGLNYTVTAASNWWGSDTGPGAVASGTGALVGLHVVYAPWCTNSGCTSMAGPVHNVRTDTYYATIQAAINAAMAGDTIEVAAGTYAEDLTINKALTLLGPNAAINPNTGTRLAEAIILPSTSNPDPSICTNAVYLTTSNITIKGFTFDGDNPALTSGVLINGADVDACELLAGYEGMGNIVVENNILKHSTYAGIDFYNYTNSSATAGNYIRYNLLEDIGETTYSYGIGILVYNNFYADITDNVLNRVRTGIQTGNFEKANPGTTGRISNNVINAWRLGIFHNLWYSNASVISVDHNTINAVTYPGATKWNGMLLSTFQGNTNTIVADNIINIPASITFPAPGYTAGYNVWSDSTSAALTISGGTVTGGDYGVFVNNYEGYVSNGANTNIILDGLTIRDSIVAGVYVKDSPDNTNGSTVFANIKNSTIDTAGTGILIEGADATAQANFNKIVDNPIIGANNTTSTLMNAESNWWGSTNPVWGSTVSGSVDYTPWCLDAACQTLSAIVALGDPTGTLTSWDKSFEWTGLSNATWYELQVQTMSGTIVYDQWFTSSVTGCGTGTACAVTILPDLPNGDYQWRIQDYGPYGYGNWTGFQPFTLNLPDAEIVLGDPSGTLTSWDKSFEWTGLSNASWYELQVQKTDGTIVYDEWYTRLQAGCNTGSTCAVTILPDLSNGDYQWRIQDYGPYGYGSWTTFQPFTLNLPDAEIVLGDPTGTLTSWDKSFEWMGLSNATWYELQVQTSDGTIAYDEWYTSSETGCGIGTTCAITILPDLPNGDYQWRIKDYGAYGYGSWTAFQHFTLNLSTVGIVLENPSGTLTSWDKSFEWTGLSNASWYELQVQKTDGTIVYDEWYTRLQAGCNTGSTCAVTILPDLSNGYYQWRIQDYGPYGYGSWTAFQSFTLDVSAAGAILGQPSDTLTSWDKSFEWTGLSNATWYELDVEDAGGNTLFSQWYPADNVCTATNCSATPMETMGLSNGDYTWRIRDYGPYGYGSWTAFQLFTLNLP